MSMVWLPAADAGLGKDVLGGKAFGIAKMLRLGLPVPPAFTLTTDECGRFHAAGRVLPADIVASLADGISLLEKATGRGFGDPTRPLLVSVRSGAAQSMPGMMDTILNLGMTDAVRSALVEQSGDAGYAADTRATLRRAVRTGRRDRSPGRSGGPTARRGRRGLRLLVLRAGRRLPGAPRRRLRRWHLGHRPGDGVRQPRRRLRDRSPVLPQPVDRRPRPLRRMAATGTGRGRGLRPVRRRAVGSARCHSRRCAHPVVGPRERTGA